MKLESISAELLDKLGDQLSNQEVSTSAPKSADPKHFPVFSTPINSKRLVYVPKVQGEFRPDIAYVHSLGKEARYASYRCINGIELDGVYDGTCPFCDATSEGWDLANFLIKDKCASMGYNPDDKSNKEVKSIRSSLFSQRAVKESVARVTFPILVIETVNNDGKTLLVEDGELKTTPMFYSISKSQYDDTWQKTLSNMEDEPDSPSGYFFTLDYTYSVNEGVSPNARDSAKALNVAYKSYKALKAEDQLKELVPQFDKLFDEWTPQTMRKVLYANMLYAQEDLKKVCDEVMEGTRNRLAIFEASNSSSTNALESTLIPTALPNKEDSNLVPVGNLSLGEDDVDEQ